MVIVTFRERNDQLTAVFGATFKTPEAAKAFIKEDAEFWGQHRDAEKKGWKLVNADPNGLDYYEWLDTSGKALITYQYFKM